MGFGQDQVADVFLSRLFRIEQRADDTETFDCPLAPNLAAEREATEHRPMRAQDIPIMLILVTQARFVGCIKGVHLSLHHRAPLPLR